MKGEVMGEGGVRSRGERREREGVEGKRGEGNGGERSWRGWGRGRRVGGGVQEVLVLGDKRREGFEEAL